jgi:membrane-bound lytic murein transglycosylase F
MVELSDKAHKLHIAAGVLAALLVFAALVAMPLLNQPELNQLETIQQRGSLKMLTLNGASTYYQAARGANGFEYQLGRQFAEHLGVELEVVTVDHFADLYQELLFNGGDFAAAGLSPEDTAVSEGIGFGPAYHTVQPQLLYRKAEGKRPKKLEDLASGVVEVLAGSSHQALIERLAKKTNGLSVHVNREVGVEEMIELVDQGLIDYVVADSHEIALQRRFFPELRVGFDLGDARTLRWAYKSSEPTDPSLSGAMRAFFMAIQEKGRLDQLVHRHFSHVEDFNYSDLQTFSLHVRERLPQYRPMFEKVAEEEGLDWRLLAAIGYQESLWNPKAKSPTGVRGLMMLTQNTAKMMGITDRLDPAQSISGGARYFKRVMKKIPERIQQPDRSWLALASYNVGFGHLEDARRITQRNGGDPDRWIDVKESLPLLSRKKWYEQTKHGYARGWEPVKYVANIRKYYDLLVWLEQRETNADNPFEALPDSDRIILPPSF